MAALTNHPITNPTTAATHLERLVADRALKHHPLPLPSLPLPSLPPAPPPPAPAIAIAIIIVIPAALLVRKPEGHRPARLLLLAARRLRLLPLLRLRAEKMGWKWINDEG